MLLDVTIHLSYPLAFLAGLVSFLSPCVFPLVPAYAAFLGGQAGDGWAESEAPGAALREGPGAAVARPTWTPRRVPMVANGVAFVLGFSAVFIAFFYVLRALDVTLLVEHQRTVNLVAGAIIVLLGLQTLGVIRVGSLMRERRLHLNPERRGLVPAFLLGLTFAAGWTPCIGPQLAAILSVAEQRDFAGLPVMIVYCLGLAVPFLVVAVLADRLQGVIRAVNRHLGLVNLVAGGLLLVFGALLMLDRFTFFNRFASWAPFDL